MHQRKLSQLLAAINVALRLSNHVRVLRLVLSNFGNVPDPAPLRERVAIVLAERGRKKEAVEILELVGRHYANVGQPARAIATAKQLQRLKPDTTNLLDHIATIYNIRSPFLAASGESTYVPEDAHEIDLDANEPVLAVPELLQLAVARSLERTDIATQPGSLPTIPLLSLLPRDTFRDVLEAMEYEVFDEVQPVLEEGKIYEELIWTATDDLILEDGDQAMRLPACSLLGLSSFGQSQRAAEVNVMTQPGSEVVRLSSDAIHAVTRETPDFPSRLSTLRRHAMTERLLERHALFQGLNSSDRVEVVEAFTGMRVQQGEVIIRQRSASPGLFIILDGEVDIIRQDDDWEITVATLRSGEVFGEIGLIADQPAVAGCVMTTGGHLLHLPRAEFHALTQRFPTVHAYTEQLAAERMSEVVLSATDLAEVE